MQCPRRPGNTIREELENLMPTLTSAQAVAVINAARENADAIGIPVSIAVADGAGMLIALHRMDGSNPITADVAHAKARSAALFRLRTSEAEALLARHPGLLTLPNMVCIGGGVPIIVEGECLGAVGVSGASAEEDEVAADAGIAVLG